MRTDDDICQFPIKDQNQKIIHENRMIEITKLPQEMNFKPTSENCCSKGQRVLL